MQPTARDAPDCPRARLWDQVRAICIASQSTSFMPPLLCTWCTNANWNPEPKHTPAWQRESRLPKPFQPPTGIWTADTAPHASRNVEREPCFASNRESSADNCSSAELEHRTPKVSQLQTRILDPKRISTAPTGIHKPKRFQPPTVIQILVPFPHSARPRSSSPPETSTPRSSAL